MRISMVGGGFNVVRGNGRGNEHEVKSETLVDSRGRVETHMAAAQLAYRSLDRHAPLPESAVASLDVRLSLRFSSAK